MDIVGALPPLWGKEYIITMIDRAAKWPEAILVSSIMMNKSQIL